MKYLKCLECLELKVAGVKPYLSHISSNFKYSKYFTHY
jgi:hypothetical protein